MKIAVRYFTRTGNTEKLMRAVAEAVGVTAETIDEPLSERVDVLFLGASYYAFDLDPLVKQFLADNRENFGTVAVLGTSAMMKSMMKPLRRVAKTSGFTAYPEDFHCPGHWKFANKGRPNEEDLSAAVRFATDVLEKMTK